MLLQEVLTTFGSSPNRLLNEAQNALKLIEDGKVTLDVDGAHLIGKLLTQCASTTKQGLPATSLKAGVTLAKIIRNAGKKKAEVAQALLQGSYANALCALTRAAAAALHSRSLPFVETVDCLDSLLDSIDDASRLSFKDTAGGGAQDKQTKPTRIRGLTAIGNLAIPALLDVLFLITTIPEGYDSLLPLCKYAAERLVDFLVRSSENCLILASAPQIAGGKALTAVVDLCGNYTLQLDIAECLYHCAQASFEGVPGQFPGLQRCPLYDPIKKIAMKDELPMEDLAGELRKVLVEHNSNVGKEARVNSLSAKHVTVCGRSGISAPGSCVDLGLTSLNLTLMMSSPTPHTNGEGASQDTFLDGCGSPDEGAVPAVPDLVEFPYADFAGAEVTVNRSGGPGNGQDGIEETVNVAISLRKLPVVLEEEGFGGTDNDLINSRTIVLSFSAADIEKLQKNVPHVAAAMRAARIPLPSIGNGEADLSQPERRRKVSLATIAISRKLSDHRTSNPSRPTKPATMQPVIPLYQRMQAAHPPSAAPSVTGAISRSGPAPTEAAAVSAPNPPHSDNNIEIEQKAANIEEKEWSDDALSPDSPKAAKTAPAAQLEEQQNGAAEDGPKKREWRTTKRGTEDVQEALPNPADKPTKNGGAPTKTIKEQPSKAAAGKVAKRTRAANGPAPLPLEIVENPTEDPGKESKLKPAKGTGKGRGGGGAQAAKKKAPAAPAAEKKKAPSLKATVPVLPRRTGRITVVVPAKDADLDDLDMNIDEDGVVQGKASGRPAGKTADPPLPAVHHDEGTTFKKKARGGTGTSEAALVLGAPSGGPGVSPLALPESEEGKDELPDWMSRAAVPAPRSSPVLKSYYNPSPQGNCTGPHLYDISSSDDDDDFNMNAAYTAAAADVAAIVAGKDVRPAPGKKGTGTATVTGKKGTGTGAKQATLAAVKKPRAAATKRQAGAASKAAKSIKTSKATAAAAAPAGDGKRGQRKQPGRGGAKATATASKFADKSTIMQEAGQVMDDDLQDVHPPALTAAPAGVLAPVGTLNVKFAGTTITSPICTTMMDWDKEMTYGNQLMGADGTGDGAYDRTGGDLDLDLNGGGGGTDYWGGADGADVDPAWIPATQRPLHASLSSPDEDLVDLGEDLLEDPIEDPSDPQVFAAKLKSTRKKGQSEKGAAGVGARGVHGVRNLKAALANNGVTDARNNEEEEKSSPPAPTGATATGIKRHLGTTAEVLRKRSPPSTFKGKGKSRLAAMKGTTTTSTGGKNAAAVAAAAAAYTPARLQTTTPAAEVGKKRGAGSDEPAIKTKAKSKVTATEATMVFVTREKRAAAAAAQLGIVLEAGTSADDDIDVRDIPGQFDGAPEGGSLEAVGPTPEDEDNMMMEVIPPPARATRAVPAAQAKQAKQAKTAAAAKGKGAAAKAEPARKAPAVEKHAAAATTKAVSKPRTTKVQAVPPTRRQSAAAGGTRAWGFTAAVAAEEEDTAAAFEGLLDGPDDDFEIDLGSDIGESDQEEDLAAARGSTGGNGRGRGRGRGGGGGGGGGGGTAGLLALLQNGLGGGHIGSPESDEDDQMDDEDLDDDEDDGMGSGLVQIQAAIAQTMAARQRKAQQARNAQVKKLEKETKGVLAVAHAEVQAGVSAAETAAAEKLATMVDRVKENEEEIRAVQEDYATKMAELSEKQRALAAEVERTEQESARQVAEARSTGKRKLHEAFAAVKSKLEDGKKRIQRAAKRARRMPDLASLLLPLFASG